LPKVVVVVLLRCCFVITLVCKRVLLLCLSFPVVDKIKVYNSVCIRAFQLWTELKSTTVVDRRALQLLTRSRSTIEFYLLSKTSLFVEVFDLQGNESVRRFEERFEQNRIRLTVSTAH
jgi:hypothetical protein